MSESAAKLRVKVTLHRDLPVEPMPQLQRAKTPTSKLKLMLLMSVLVAAGFWGWQQLNNSAATAEAARLEEVVANDDNPGTEFVAADAEPVALQPKEEIVLTENNSSNGMQHQPVVNQSVIADPIQASALATTQAGAEPGVGHATTVEKNNISESANTGSVRLPKGFSRIVLAADMEQLEPGKPVAQLVAKKDIQRLYLFTELNGYAGQQLRHRWSFQGTIQTEALLTIEDSPWRTYSEKWLLPDQLGAWRVEIIDQQQNVLYSHDFQYQ